MSIIEYLQNKVKDRIMLYTVFGTCEVMDQPLLSVAEMRLDLLGHMYPFRIIVAVKVPNFTLVDVFALQLTFGRVAYFSRV